MEHIADFFKESGHRDRQFPVDEAGWDRLSKALDQKKKKRWLPFWWSFGGMLVCTIGLGIWWVATTADTDHFDLPKQQIGIEPEITSSPIDPSPQKTQTSRPTLTPQATETEITPITNEEGDEAIAESKTEPSLSGPVPEIVPIASPGKTKTPSLLDKQIALETRPSEAVVPIEESVVLEATAERNSIKTIPLISPLPGGGTVDLSAKQLLARTAQSDILTKEKKKQQKRRPYPQADRYQNAATTTLQRMFASPAYGSTIQGEEINAWRENKVGGRWQLALGAGTIPASYLGSLSYFSTQPITGVVSSPYTMADGSTIDLYYDGFIRDNNRVSQNFNFYRLSLFRELGKGLSIKGSILIASTSDRTPGKLINQIPDRPNVAYFTNNNRGTNWMGEVGLQYTFYRRQRYQPFISLSVFNVFTNSFKSERRFVWPGMGVDEVSFTGSSVSTTNLPGYYFEIGGQFLATPSWSIGPSFVITGTPFVEPQLGFGLEARYRW